MSHDEHLISMAGGDGDPLDAIQVRSDYALTHESLAASDYAEMAWDSARDVPALLAIVRTQQATIDRVLTLANTSGRTGWRISADELRKTLRGES